MDKINKKFRLDVVEIFSLIFKENAAYTVLTIQGDCEYNITRFDANFPDIFSFNLSWAFTNETSYYSDHKQKNCDLYQPGLEPLKPVSLCMDNGETPIFLQYTNSTTMKSDYITFHNFKTGAVSNTTYDVPDDCVMIHDGPFKPPGGGEKVTFHHLQTQLHQHLMMI